MVAVVSGAQFTKGPWIADEFCEENDQATRVGTYDGTPLYYHRTATIALCQTNHDDDEPDGVPKIGIVEAEANARLIAAAPALYGALTAAPSLPATFDQYDGFASEYRAFREKRAAALSAARGDHE